MSYIHRWLSNKVGGVFTHTVHKAVVFSTWYFSLLALLVKFKLLCTAGFKLTVPFKLLHASSCSVLLCTHFQMSHDRN